MRRLREHTAAVHAATEALPLMQQVLAAQPTYAGYARYLGVLHGVFLAVEPQLYAAVPSPLHTALGITPKLPALRQDLLDLDDLYPGATDGLSIGHVPEADVCAPVRRLLTDGQSTAMALGGLYVLEGATLGGQVIARRLRNNWRTHQPDGPGLPTAFLDFRSQQSPRDWRRFGAALSRWAERHPGSEPAVLEGALRVFQHMHTTFASASSR